MNIFSVVYIVLLLITLISYFTQFRKKDLYVKLVILLLILWLITTVAAIYATKYAGLKNNLFIFHIFTPLEYIILALFFREIIANATVKRLLTYSIPLFIFVAILFTLFIQKLDQSNSGIITLESVIMIFLSLFFLREVLLLQQATVLHKFPLFWIIVGLLFYFTGNLVIEGMLNYVIIHSMQLAKRIYYIGHIFKYLLFISFTIGAFCNSLALVSLNRNR